MNANEEITAGAIQQSSARVFLEYLEALELKLDRVRTYALSVGDERLLEIVGERDDV